ncbi:MULTISPECIES: hypothetical protein, partial [Cyanophyceae]
AVGKKPRGGGVVKNGDPTDPRDAHGGTTCTLAPLRTAAGRGVPGTAVQPLTLRRRPGRSRRCQPERNLTLGLASC